MRLIPKLATSLATISGLGAASFIGYTIFQSARQFDHAPTMADLEERRKELDHREKNLDLQNTQVNQALAALREMKQHEVYSAEQQPECLVSP